MASPVLSTHPLGFQWPGYDPFLFCVHHEDAYPKGTATLGPAAPLAGRDLGQDFEGKDGWRMYHGLEVPGFPAHPHRGFETVTIVRRGFCDHSDSLGAKARFGEGDVQWLTAGAGIVHSEMFPLLSRDQSNPLELFQIWLNLPKSDKLVPPHFGMLWNEAIPRSRAPGVEVTVIAGALDGLRPPSPPPHSWASRADSNLAIWSVKLATGAAWKVPAVPQGVNRTLYFFRGTSLDVAGTRLPLNTSAQLSADEVPLSAEGECEALLLQARPIAEPVVQYGPFVMNSPAEIRQTFLDFERTRFGGWPWGSDDPNHGASAGRFAVHAGGRLEEPQPGSMARAVLPLVR